MMKRTILFIILLMALSAASGFLMSKASWIGRVGMTLFYKEYNLLKVWWQGGIAVFIVIMFLFFIHNLLYNKLPVIAAKFSHFILLLAAIAGFYITYLDFTDDFSHRMLGRRFHYGFYLAWIEWMLVCLFFLFKKKKKKIFAIDSNKTEPTVQ